MEEVILVDEQDNPIGTMEKLQAHQQAKLHRAFSVFIFNSQGEMLLQQRAFDKYHSAGLWTNACCSHPRPYETVLEAAHRRLKEEMGISTLLEFAFSFIYKAYFDNNLTEYELDHVLVGKYDESPTINIDEVSDYKWISIEELQKSIKQKPKIYTVWMLEIMNNHSIENFLK